MAPRVKKFTPKEKKTITPAPDWKKLQAAETEEDRLEAWRDCEYFVHMEVSNKEYLHSAKKWVRDYSGWDLYSEMIRVPDVYLSTICKHGWKAYRLGYMPEKIKGQFKTQLLSMISRVEKLRETMTYDPPIHSSLDDLDDDHPLHVTKVKEWLEHWKKYVASFKKNETPTKEEVIAQTYVYNIQMYLRSGVWLDSHYGELRENKVNYLCIAPAFDKDGLIKRTVGVFYKDVGQIWSKELE
jgi:hypothetical protein